MDVFWNLTITGIIFLLIYFCLIKPLNYWKEKKVPQYHFLVTWRGILLGFIRQRSLSVMVENMYKDFPDHRYFGIYLFFKPIIVLRDPELIKQIAVKDFDHFVDHSQFLPEDSEPLWEKNLFALKGDKWRDMRATLSPSFTGSKMKLMFGLIVESAKQFVHYFEEQGAEVVEVEMKDTFTRFANDVIASVAFGVTCDSLKNRNNEFYLMGKEITNFKGLKNNLKFLLFFMFPKIGKFFNIKMFDPKQSAFFTKLVKDNIEQREKEGIIRPDMIHLLMEARKERLDNINLKSSSFLQNSKTKEEKRIKEQLTEMDITAQALIFFFAGFDSVSTLMCFMAHELAVNVDIQQRLQQEVDSTLEACNGHLTYDALSKMKYMDAVISESLRKWPAAVASDRVCVKPYTIATPEEEENPVDLKVGDIVWFPTFGIHRDPQFYPNPERFDPDRFSDENKINLVPYTFLAFGAGPRICIGNRFALMETKLVFLYLLNKFDIVVIGKTNVPLKIAKNPFQLTSEGGFWLGLRPRKTN